MDDTDFNRPEHSYALTAQAAVPVGRLWQLPNGKAAAFQGRTAAASGDTGLPFLTTGKFVMPKQTGIKLLDGGRAYWDRSGRVVTYKANDDRDFLVGSLVGDAESAASECTVNLNVDPVYLIDLANSPFHSIPIGTATATGLGYPKRLGGTNLLTLDSTAEAQKVDLFSLATFSKNANPIIELSFRVLDGSSGSAPDFNIGIASATHATDFDSIARYLSVHLDGNSTNLSLQSKDGTTTVAATDTTTDYTAGYTAAVREEWWLDCRDPADVQVYRNGVPMLGSSVFKIDGSAAEFALIAHLEKTSAADAFQVALDRLCVRTAEQ